MGAVLDLCNGSAQHVIVPNSKSMVENDINNKYNNDINGVKADNSNHNTNSIEEKKNKKKTSGGATNNEIINDSDTNNIISSTKGASILTPKVKKDRSPSKRSKKKDDKTSVKDNESKKEEGAEEKSSKKKKKKKSSKYRSSEQNIVLLDNNLSPKNENAIDIEEEEKENMQISDTILSEIVLSEKIKAIPREKKKKIKGRNNINIVILGYNEVGKSAFCIRFVENKYEDFYIPSIGVENYSKIIAYNDRSYKLNFSVIWGEAKIMKQENLLSAADFFLLIYDITKIRSFNQINFYLKLLKKYLVTFDKEGKSPNFCLAGNKADLEGDRKIGIDVINKCIDKYGIKHFDISIKTAKNMNNLIQYFVSIFDKISSSDK
jgi:GTPase SAR1 family protein